MSTPNLSEQLDSHLENRERLNFARQVDQEAIQAECADVLSFIERRVARINSRGQVGDTFRADECLKLVRDIKAGLHREKKK